MPSALLRGRERASILICHAGYQPADHKAVRCWPQAMSIRPPPVTMGVRLIMRNARDDRAFQNGDSSLRSVEAAPLATDDLLYLGSASNIRSISRGKGVVRLPPGVPFRPLALPPPSISDVYLLS